MKDSSAYKLDNDLDDMEATCHPAAEQSNAAPPVGAPTISDLQFATAAVWKALSSDQYDWRSVDGIAEETHLDKLAVSTILETQFGDAVVRSTDANQPGRFLYATRERYNKLRGPWNRVLSVITNQVK
jgi:hypothetical protein